MHGSACNVHGGRKLMTLLFRGEVTQERRPYEECRAALNVPRRLTVTESSRRNAQRFIQAIHCFIR